MDFIAQKVANWWCLEAKRYLWIKINIIIWALSTQHTEYLVYTQQLFDKQQLKQNWVDITKNAKNSRLKAEIGLFKKSVIDHQTKNNTFSKKKYLWTRWSKKWLNLSALKTEKRWSQCCHEKLHLKLFEKYCVDSFHYTTKSSTKKPTKTQINVLKNF